MGSEPQDVEEQDEDAIDASEDDLVDNFEAACEPNAQVRGCSSDAFALLEHYGVFGAAPGAWSSRSSLLLQSPSPLNVVASEESLSDALEEDSIHELDPDCDSFVQTDSCSI